ncbi:response regulator transcription factor [Nonomuraea endophytica]|uniref:response regulator transcription factor n=1 Tax=Nonomuraea endophytica TaxID=714136 RepID=UPI0037C65CE8
MPDSLTAKDLRALMAVIDDGKQDEPTAAMPWAVLEGLGKLIACTCVSFFHCDMAGRRKVAAQQAAAGEHDMETDFEDEEYFERSSTFLPNVYFTNMGDLTRVIGWSDFFTGRQLKNQPYFARTFLPQGLKHSVMIGLTDMPDHIRRIVLSRDSGQDFSERERLILRVLRPHLYEVYLDSQRRRNNVPQLTPRERDVLRLAAQGRSNADIARQLFITVSTVRKHLEHIYDRTGARSRTAAAALVMPHLNTPTITSRT